MSSHQAGDLGLVFDAVAKDAWDSFLNNDHQRAQRLAHQLLQQPRLGDVLKAAMHMIMATSTIDPLSHARQAVHLYEHLFDHIEQPGPKNQRWRETALEHAQELLQKAKEDRITLSENINAHYSTDEAVRHAFIQKFGEHADKKFDQEDVFFNKNDEDGDGADGDENSDEIGVQGGSEDGALPLAIAHSQSESDAGEADAHSVEQQKELDRQKDLEQQEKLKQQKLELARLDAQRLNAGLADNSYQDTEYPMPEPDETIIPADHPVHNMTFAELMDLDD